jgi:hypothetical protein
VARWPPVPHRVRAACCWLSGFRGWRVDAVVRAHASPQQIGETCGLGFPVAVRVEEVLGSLEVGRLGDVAVLSDDYFSVPDSRLRGLHSELTVLGGTAVHSGDIRYWA